MKPSLQKRACHTSQMIDAVTDIIADKSLSYVKVWETM